MIQVMTYVYVYIYVYVYVCTLTYLRVLRRVFPRKRIIFYVSHVALRAR